MPLLKNKRHELFAGLYAKTGNPSKSYAEAGYTGKGADASASKLLTSPKVAERVKEIRERVVELASEKSAVDKTWVLNQLIENVKMAKIAVPILNKKGEETFEYSQNLPAANKALELIGKELAMFIERKEVGTPGAFENLTDAEIDRRLDLASKAMAERAIKEAQKV